jgi:NADH-quinone oxidoreductase subunit C
MAISRETILSIVEAVSPEFKHTVHRNQLTVIVPLDKIVDLCYELRDNEDTSFDMLTDITAIDHAKKGFRYEVVYFLYSNKFKDRLRIKVPVHENNLHCPSMVEVWESANWYERETYDMFGIKFDGHPNLRRFYMPEDFNDPETGEPLYPLRKDFPLGGIPDSLPLPPFPEKYGDLDEN